jgi:hypothetical protein
MTGTGMVELHPGVRRVGSRYVDDARRVSLTLTRAERADSTFVEARLVAAGYARLPVGDATCRRASRLGPGHLRGIHLSFRRYHAPGSAVCAVAAVLAAAVVPALVITVGFGTLATVAGLLAGDLRTTWLAAAVGVPILIVTLVLHESAHLIVMRSVVGDGRVGAVAHSWTDVWVVGPALTPRGRRITAGVGPLAGAGSAVALLALGATPWICWLVATAHISNLLPVFADGRALWAHSL